MIDPRVYFIGSHATGKTTMARYVSRRYGLPVVPEVARQVLAEMELGFQALRTDVDSVNEYQQAVFQRQMEVEGRQEGGFVADRAFDALAYTAEHSMVLSEVYDEAAHQYIAERVSTGIVFFLRPHRDLAGRPDAALAPREDTGWDAIVRIDGMIKFLLESHGVPYLPIHSSAMQERARTVDFVLGRCLRVAEAV